MTMQAIKTAISIEKNLFEQADNLARTMKVSRSKLFVIALQDYIEHQKNKEMLAQINSAYADEPDTTEQTLRRKSRQQHRRIVGGEW
jgi:metal-responsive CopG/Arc/MetJ family transcriptional regulator